LMAPRFAQLGESLSHRDAENVRINHLLSVNPQAGGVGAAVRLVRSRLPGWIDL
jgi:hypothetical protein